MIITEEDYLEHFGVKGMKWGVRKKRYGRNPDDIIPKGSKVYRVSLSSEDPTYDNKKYVSTNKSDHRKWKNIWAVVMRQEDVKLMIFNTQPPNP